MILEQKLNNFEEHLYQLILDHWISIAPNNVIDPDNKEHRDLISELNLKMEDFVYLKFLYHKNMVKSIN